MAARGSAAEPDISPIPASRKSLIWSGSICETNVPPVVPRTVLTRLCEASTRSASRTVLRLTPKLPPISPSGGRRSPGASDPSRISSRSWSATCW